MFERKKATPKHSSQSGADARQIGAEWRKRPGAARQKKAGAKPSWMGEQSLPCDACGAELHFDPEEIGRTKLCACGHRMRLRVKQVTGNETESRGKWSTLALAFVGLVIVGVVGFLLWVSLFHQGNPDAVQGEIRPPTFDLPEESATEVLDRYFSAQTPDEILAVIRNSETLERMVKDWYRERPIEPTTFEITAVTEGWISQGGLNDAGQIWVVSASVTIPNSEKPKQMILERAKDGTFKVDWEFAVNHSEHQLGFFLERKPVVAEAFRVNIRRDDYYNYDFPSEKNWVCYRIRSETGKHELYGYAAKESEIARRLQGWYYPGEQSIPVILSLRFPPSRVAGLVEIVEAQQKNWVEPAD